MPFEILDNLHPLSPSLRLRLRYSLKIICRINERASDVWRMMERIRGGVLGHMSNIGPESLE
jgi:hypothetical protein